MAWPYVSWIKLEIKIRNIKRRPGSQLPPETGSENTLKIFVLFEVLTGSRAADFSANSHSKEAALSAGCHTQHGSPALRHGHQTHSCSSSNSHQSQTSQHRSNTASSESSKSSSSSSSSNIAGNSTDSQESEATGYNGEIY